LGYLETNKKLIVTKEAGVVTDEVSYKTQIEKSIWQALRRLSVLCSTRRRRHTQAR
jgi:hypothetical protein